MVVSAIESHDYISFSLVVAETIYKGATLNPLAIKCGNINGTPVFHENSFCICRESYNH